jgi:hypothetical protein
VAQGETRTSPSYAELERALSSVPGIVAASVTVDDATGRGRLRLRLAPGEDPDAVAWAVAATLRERFGIALDPDAIRPRIEGDDRSGVAAGQGDDAAPVGDPEPSSAPDGATEVEQRRQVVERLAAQVAASSSPRVRAAIRDLVTRQGERGVEVVATLAVGEQVGRSTARSIPSRRGVWRAVAEATVGALEQLAGERFQAGVDRVAVSTHEDAPMATVVVTLVSDRGEETLLGASLLRDDPEGAVMRATLDALNRRVEPWLRVDAG